LAQILLRNLDDTSRDRLRELAQMPLAVIFLVVWNAVVGTPFTVGVYYAMRRRNAPPA